MTDTDIKELARRLKFVQFSSFVNRDIETCHEAAEALTTLSERSRLYDAALSRLADYAEDIRKLTEENERMRGALEKHACSCTVCERQPEDRDMCCEARAALGKDTRPPVSKEAMDWAAAQKDEIEQYRKDNPDWWEKGKPLSELRAALGKDTPDGK